MHHDPIFDTEAFLTPVLFSIRTLLIAAALTALTTSAFAQAAAPTPWVLTPDMGYGYGKDGKTLSYKMGTNNAGLLLKGAKKVPKGTLFFIGTERTALYADRPVSRRRRQVHVRIELISLPFSRAGLPDLRNR